jgi:hypothetical protein
MNTNYGGGGVMRDHDHHDPVLRARQVRTLPASTLHPAAAATPPPYQVAAVYTRESYWLEQMADAEPTTDTYCGE